VLNKIDKLIMMLKLTPLQAYEHIKIILEQVNAITSTFLTAEAMTRAHKKSRKRKSGSMVRVRSMN